MARRITSSRSIGDHATSSRSSDATQRTPSPSAGTRSRGASNVEIEEKGREKRRARRLRRQFESGLRRAHVELASRRVRAPFRQRERKRARENDLATLRSRRAVNFREKRLFFRTRFCSCLRLRRRFHRFENVCREDDFSRIRVVFRERFDGERERRPAVSRGGRDAFSRGGDEFVGEQEKRLVVREKNAARQPPSALKRD